MRRNVVNAKLSKELAKATELLEKQRRALEAAQAKLKQSEMDTRFKATKSTQRLYPNWDGSTSEEGDEDGSKGGSRSKGDDDSNDEDDEDDGDDDGGDAHLKQQPTTINRPAAITESTEFASPTKIYMQHFQQLGFYPYMVHFDGDGQIEDVLDSYTPKDKISKKNDENEQDDENDGNEQDDEDDENEQEKRERAAAKQAAKQAAVAKAAMGDSSSSNDSDGDSPVAAPRVSAVPDCFGEGRPRRHGSHARLVSSQRNWTCVVSV